MSLTKLLNIYWPKAPLVATFLPQSPKEIKLQAQVPWCQRISLHSGTSTPQRSQFAPWLIHFWSTPPSPHLGTGKEAKDGPKPWAPAPAPGSQLQEQSFREWVTDGRSLSLSLLSLLLFVTLSNNKINHKTKTKKNKISPQWQLTYHNHKKWMLLALPCTNGEIKAQRKKSNSFKTTQLLS